MGSEMCIRDRHFEEGIILTRGGKTPPAWEKGARKDIYDIGRDPESRENVEMAIHIREFAGTYMEHCHNTQHEDTSMLLRWDSEHPGQFQLMPTPLPSWDGVKFVDSVALPTFRTGDGVGPQVNVNNTQEVNSGSGSSGSGNRSSGGKG